MSEIVSLGRLRDDQVIQLRLPGGELLASHVRLALSPWRRLRGLLGGPPLAQEEAMLLRPCNGVHTLFMGYPIDVVFLDQRGEIVAVRGELRPWRATGIIAGARAVLELAAGAAARAGLRAGQLVAFELKH